jgi:hypothetical protein
MRAHSGGSAAGVPVIPPDTTPLKVAFDRFAPLRDAPVKIAPVKLADERLAVDRFRPAKFALVKLAVGPTK